MATQGQQGRRQGRRQEGRAEGRGEGRGGFEGRQGGQGGPAAPGGGLHQAVARGRGTGRRGAAPEDALRAGGARACWPSSSASSNTHEIPTLEKIVLNCGVGEAVKQPKLLDVVVEELALITGQKPVRRKAKKSISNFGLREGQEIGASVTLRGARMWEFLDRFVTVACPRIRDFRGLGTQVVRRPRQLHARHQGADDLPRDQLRHGRVRSTAWTSRS